jgi:hypothetical protein
LFQESLLLLASVLCWCHAAVDIADVTDIPAFVGVSTFGGIPVVACTAAGAPTVARISVVVGFPTVFGIPSIVGIPAVVGHLFCPKSPLFLTFPATAGVTSVDATLADTVVFALVCFPTFANFPYIAGVHTCSDHLDPIFYQERVSQQPRERPIFF